MSEDLMQVGVVGIRAPDGTVKKSVPLYRPSTPEDVAAERATMNEFALVACKFMSAARKLNNIKL